MIADELRRRAERVLAQSDATLPRAAAAYDEVAGGRPIVLVGAGALGRHTAGRLESFGLPARAFADNSRALVGSVVSGLPVMGVAQAVEQHGDEAVFVVTVYNRASISRQLAQLGCRRVVPYALLWARRAEAFLPYFCLDDPKRLAASRADILAAVDVWHDDASRAEYAAQLERRAFMGFDRASEEIGADFRASEYFAEELYAPRPDEVLVDCGAFSGDTVERFVERRRGRFARIIALEPDPMNYAALVGRVARLPAPVRERIVTREVAIAAAPGTVRFSSGGGVSSAVSHAGEVEVRSDTLDAILDGERPTLLKMDIEGLEVDALRGAKAIMRREEAVLAVSLYHRPEDLWQIPLVVRETAPGYRLLLRAHAEDCWDSCLYAVPTDRLTPQPTP